MKKRIKLSFCFLTMLVFCLALTVAAFAESLWDTKPTSEPADSGYCYDWVNSQKVETNIKWEIHNVGSEASPNYTIYFYIDEFIDSTNTLLSSQMNNDASPTAAENNYNWADGGVNVYKKHSFYNAENPDIFKNIKTIVIGDGITGLKNGAFVAMYTVTTIEMPESLVSMNGAAFKNMTALKSVYTRGVNEPKDGVIDLSNLTSINFGVNYLFCGLDQATKYVWNEALDTGSGKTIGWSAFINNKKLTSIELPSTGNLTDVGSYTFQNCTALLEITIPSRYTNIPALAFVNCNALETVYCKIGSKAYDFAEEYGYLPPLASLIPDADENTPNGYCLDYVNSAAVSTNIKWELHNFGTVDAPSYTLYFYIDDSIDSTNTVLSSQMNSDASSSNVNGYGWASEGTAVLEKHPWYDSATISKIKNIVIADGITGLKNGAFVGMNSVEKIEMPESLVSIKGAAFKGMTNLISVYTRGVSKAEDYIVDLRNVTYISFDANYFFNGIKKIKEYRFNPELSTTTNPAQYIFSGNTALEALDISMLDFNEIDYNTFKGGTSLKKLTISSKITTLKESFADCISLEGIYAPIGSAGHTYAMQKGYDTTHAIEVYDTVEDVANVHCATLTFDPVEKRATVHKVLENGWWEFDPYNNASIKAFMNAYKDYTVFFDFDGNFSKIRSFYGLFSNYTKLESVLFVKDQRLVDWWGNGNIFSGCTSLRTVYFGAEEDMVMGVADFSGMGIYKEDNPEEFTKGLFKNCTSLTDVILPNLNNTENSPAINTTTFEGCSSLRYVKIPKTITAIEDGAFSGLTSLTKMDFEAPVSVISADTFVGTKGLVVFCQSEADAEAVNEVLLNGGISPSETFAFYRSGMKIPGYSVRVDKSETANNGLRTHFAFDKTVATGFTLVEFGTLSATKSTWSNYSESFGFDDSVLELDSNGEIISRDNIVKTPIYKNGEYVNNSVNDDETNITFSVTIINFVGEAQYKAEIVSSGYEIWQKDGNYYVIYTRENALGYNSISLYKTILGMLSDRAIKISFGDNPLWNVLNDCAKTELALDNALIDGYLFDDPINSNKKIALYLNNGEEKAELKSLGFDFSERNTVSSIIFGENIEYSLPEIDEYWEKHIIEKLNSLPEGKSFIAITDTHFQSDKARNTRKAANLIEYIRYQTGINKVVNLGDPYSGEPTIEMANELFKTSVEEYFYDVFGDDGIFVVGNHDANYTSLSTEALNEAYKYLLPDTAIYNASVAHIASLENVVFDDEMLAKADELEYSDLGDKYTAEQMKEEFIAWVKQHYYYDDPAQKIRYIAYNAGNCGITEYYTLGKTLWDVHESQLDFIADALITAPADYDIVFCGHMLASNSEYSTDFSELYKLLSAFKGGYSVTLSIDVSKKNENYKKLVGETKKTFDFSGTNFEGALFTIGGHWHSESSFVWQTEGVNYRTNIPYDEEKITDDAIFYIGLNNDCIENGSDIKPQKGTVTENCFYIITITPEGNIVVTGIGAGVSRTLKYN